MAVSRFSYRRTFGGVQEQPSGGYSRQDRRPIVVGTENGGHTRNRPSGEPVHEDFGVSTAAEKLERALAHQRAGQPRVAEAIIRQILQVEPANFDACRGLGAALRAQGKPAEAITWLERAVALKPESAAARVDLGGALAQARRFDESVAQLEQALRLAPGAAEIDGALRQTLAMRQTGLASDFINQGRLDLAEPCCRKAVELAPNQVAAHGNLGSVLKGQGKLDEAEACFRRVLELNDRDVEAHRKLGSIALEQRRFAEAAAWFRRTLELNPALVDLHHQLGAALIELEQFSEAEAILRRLRELNPGHVEACNNLGVAVAKQRRFGEAIDIFRQALQIQPDYAEAHFNLGNALKEQNLLSEAVPCFQRALEIDPNHTPAELALAFTLLAMGRLAEGWHHYERRWRTPQLMSVPRREPRWKGEDLAGRTILLGREQGFGDTLQFIRYAELLHERGAKVIVECACQLAKLLTTCPGVDEVRIAGDPIPPFDFALPLMSLPGVFGTTLESIPARVPYLRPDADLVERWRDALGNRSEFKVAIAWHGQPSHTSDRFRSIPLAQFEPIARATGIRLYSIQVGHGREQLGGVAKDWPIVDLGDKLGDFCDTAAVLCNCDLLITCDSAPAHLAGALGIPVWVALYFAPDWRWMLARPDSPWYPTMRLFRQTRPDDWSDVFVRMAGELAKRLGR
jgi:tetratricopeptide (TPR) repeat protein